MPRVRLDVRDLPPPVPSLDTFGAVQVRREVEQVTVLGHGPMELFAEFELVMTDGAPDFRGPYVQGKRGDRFVYISWGFSEDSDDFGMYRGPR